MKTIFFVILLTASVCAARTPLISYDPNTVINSPTDPNNVSITITVEITKDQYAAMQELGKTLHDAVSRSSLSRVLNRWVAQAKAMMTEKYTVTELEAKLKE